jgi:hypothetical protein
VDYAEWDFKLAIPDKDGVPEREHLRQVEKQTGRTPLALISPEFPVELEYLWDYFLELSATRPQGYSGPLSITYQEIAAWKDLTGKIVTPMDVEVIKRLDQTYLRVVSNGRS